ncbi:hypothetical protein LCGC14_2645960 [marine sediment metagenome]|uniref:Sulfotransferase domain-containing protein n=1 Tax=marine sediment metagenome TaxID=412755 RepID=A0A0F8ZW98_9ZZZZ
MIPYVKPDYSLFSYPKSGRTWIRMIFARVLFNLGINPLKNEMLAASHTTCKSVRKKHDPSKINALFLYRDPRDCVVSRYFEVTRRPINRHLPRPSFYQRKKNKRMKKVSCSTLPEYIRRDDQYGIGYIVTYMNEWIKNKDIFSSFLPVSYEELHSNTVVEVSKILNFLEVDCTEDIVQESVEYSSFQNMRKIEESGEGNLLKNYHGTFGRRHRESDPESFRTRKGKIGSFVEYLDGEDIKLSNIVMKRLLDRFFCYGEDNAD